jgi:filamentous hemagglutinin family protein
MATSCLASVLSFNAPAMAVTGGSTPTVMAGQATLTGIGSQTAQINQTTQKAIINWSALSLSAAQSLTFHQPDAQSITLNRVTGGSSSSIDGTLTANGQVWIINPNGVLFGPNASLNVAGLLATTADIQNQNFIAGAYKFDSASANPNAAIINQGRITATDGGAVLLAGTNVANQGMITAQLGSVTLAGAQTFTVDFYGDKLLSFAIDGAVATAPKDASGNPVGWLVNNSGTLSAKGGQVMMTARAASSVIDHLINMSGQIEATHVSLHNGTVILDSGEGSIDVSGSITAQNGSVTIGSAGANSVTLEKGAVIDATGGQVESSGRAVSLGIASVKAASWLLDPTDFIIDSTAATAIDHGQRRQRQQWQRWRQQWRYRRQCAAVLVEPHTDPECRAQCRYQCQYLGRRQRRSVNGRVLQPRHHHRQCLGHPGQRRRAQYQQSELHADHQRQPVSHHRRRQLCSGHHAQQLWNDHPELGLLRHTRRIGQFDRQCRGQHRLFSRQYRHHP